MIPDILAKLVRESQVVPEDHPIEVVPTRNPEFGDYQCNVAMGLAKALRDNPRAIAQKIKDAVLANIGAQIATTIPEAAMVGSVGVEGPGFINFRLDDTWLAHQVHVMRLDDTLGTPYAGGKTLVIDFSSPNVAKRMHVGHLRSTVIGNALARLYKHLGWTVISDNHLGDWGTQFGKLIVAFNRWWPKGMEDLSIEDMEALYARFNRELSLDASLMDEAREATARLQKLDPESPDVHLWRHLCYRTVEEGQAIYGRLNVSFTVTLGESFYHDKTGPLVDRLLALGAAREDEDGSVHVLDTEDEPIGVVRKRDGADTYMVTDLAAIEYRLGRWAPDTIAYVTDIRQRASHFYPLFRAAIPLYPSPPPNMVHVGFGMLRLPDGGVVANRKGNVIHLQDVLDESVRRARAVVDEKSPDLPPEVRGMISQVVGVNAVIYADLRQNPESDLIFDWDRTLALEGNTAPFLMYTYARCKSLLWEARGDTLWDGINFTHPTERALAYTLARTAEEIVKAAESWSPHVLAGHLYAVTTAFNRFYASCRVLDRDTAVKSSRLALVSTTAHVMKTGMEILGLRTLDRM